MTIAYNAFNPQKGPSIGSSRSNKIRVKTNDFGDGYSQVIPDGINTHQQEISIKWDYLSESNADAIENFFIDQNGSPFLYTLPGESTVKKWRCIEWLSSYQEKGGRSITATFTRMYV